jgi:hypothetical protein
MGVAHLRLYGERLPGLRKNVIVESAIPVSCRNGFQKFHLLYAHVVLWKES